MRRKGEAVPYGASRQALAEEVGGFVAACRGDLDKNAIQRMECGKRFVTDIELKALARVLNVRYEHLLDDEIK